MDLQIDPKLLRSINSTKKLLGKHISKPVLADKYLGRPPFRFLLEIVNSVIQQTNFMNDVFSPKELKYDDISSAEDKRAILKKVIEAIENETGEKCGARTSKILSGKEPEKTNEMLQLLAKAISNFTSKSKGKSEKSNISEKPTISRAEGAKIKTTMKESPKDGHKLEVSKEHNEVKKKPEPSKIRPSAVASTPPSKKPSNSNSTSNVKNKPSADKLNMTIKSKSSKIKNSVSSTLTKVSSKETLKSKIGSPSPSSLAIVPPKKISSSNLAKSLSRQSLTAKSSTSSIKVALPAPPEPITSKLEEETVQKSKSTDKLHQKLEDSPVTTSGGAAMPPETNAEVPLQRPVTRTKYRQKTTEGVETVETTAIGNEVSESTPPDHPLTCEAPEGDNSQALQNERKEDDVCCGVRSGRSSSSDEVVTEHMNEKISEWRATSAETVQRMEPESVRDQHLQKNGWITEEPKETSYESGKTSNPMNRVFDSVENFTAENDNSIENGQSEKVVIPQVSTTTREDRNKKIFKRPITVLRDNQSGDEDDDTFLVQEKIESERDMALERLQQSAILMNIAGSSSTASIDMTCLPSDHRGLLVNQIMETQRELEKLSTTGHHNSYRHQNHHHLLENALAERDKAAVREVYVGQIEDLKGAIQKMSKCANPLANIIQRSQDDACLMEIEFRKLKQENERLQKKIDEAKTETTRHLYPLTEELAQLDTRIDKVEGAIVLAKQRLSLIDSEYAGDFIAQLENTPTEDEAQASLLESDPIVQFRGSFAGNDDEDDEVQNKSLMDVFKRAVDMHEGSSWTDVNQQRYDNGFQRATNGITPPSRMWTTTQSTPKSERRLMNRTVYGDSSPLGRRSNRILRQLEQEEPPFDKENKPSWWD